MLVDELLIPDRRGPIPVPLDERITVFAGLAAPGRGRLVDYLVGAVAGTGPAVARIRDAGGETAVIGPDGATPAAGGVEGAPTPAGAPPRTPLRRAMVVTAEDLGLEATPPHPALLAERTATTLALRQLEAELAAIEAAAAEAQRLRDELDAPTRLLVPASSAVAGGPDDEGGPDGRTLVAAAPLIDRLLLRRQSAEDVLVGGVASTELLSRPPDAPGRDPAHRRAEAEIEECDRELAALAVEVGVAVGTDGPGPALTRAVGARVRARTRFGAAPPADDAAHRLVARRRAMVRARIEELPTPDDVQAARRRVRIAGDHLARLGGAGPPVAAVRNVLLGRAAALRPQGVAPIAPLVLDDPLAGLDPSARCELLDVVARVAERTQVVILTEDPVVRTWAEHRAGRGHLRLVDLTPAG